MKVERLQLRSFTVFERMDLAFAPGINVFIGENGTGKTHLLKVVYAMLRGAPRQAVDAREAARLQKQELGDVFLPDEGDVGRLVRSSSDSGTSSVWIETDAGKSRVRIDSSSGEVVLEEQDLRPGPEAIFLPARDVLAMFEGFIALYSRQKISFDKTYHDICLALEDAELRSGAELDVPLLEEMLGGEVRLRGGKFYVHFSDGAREAHLVAEGLRKVATLARLLKNGSIGPGTVLLWDEPEANMNPRLIAKLAGVLHELAARGVQIFVATHDFLLSQELSLISEYDKAPPIEMRFFALHHASRVAPVEVEVEKNLASMEHNAILDEYAAHYDRERAAFGDAARGGEEEA